MQRLLIGITFIFLMHELIGQAPSDTMASMAQQNSQPFINVERFGAVGDSSTDNTMAFRKAIAYAESLGGGIVFIPTGNYFIDSLRIPRRVSLIGSGVGATKLLLRKNYSGVVMLSLHNTDESTIKDFTLDGNKEHQSHPIHGIVISTDSGGNIGKKNGDPTNYNYQLLVTRVYVRNFTGNGIVALHPAWVFAVRDYRVRDNDGWGVWNESTDSEFSDNGVSNNGQGGIYNRGANTRFIGGKILWNGRDNPEGAGIYCHGGNRSQFIGMEVQESYYHGIVLDNTFDAVVQVVSDMNNVKRRPSSLQLSTEDRQDPNAVGYALKMVASKNNSINIQITSGLAGGKLTQFGKFIDGNSTGNVFILNERKQMLGDSIVFAAKNEWITYNDATRIIKTDEDFEVTEDTSTYIINSKLSKNRTITLIDPSKTLMKKLTFVFPGEENEKFHWRFNNAVKPSAGLNEILPANSIVTVERFDIGAGQWRITNVWQPAKNKKSDKGKGFFDDEFSNSISTKNRKEAMLVNYSPPDNTSGTFTVEIHGMNETGELAAYKRVVRYKMIHGVLKLFTVKIPVDDDEDPSLQDCDIIFVEASLQKGIIQVNAKGINNPVKWKANVGVSYISL